jgi:lipopolysaccharide export system protein LptC
VKVLDKILFIGLFGALGLLSTWLQFGIIEQDQEVFDGSQRHDPDYYVENFTATGMDENGRRKYVLEAERLVHYPDDDTALLDKPHVIKYEEGSPPQHTYADSGWVSSDGNEVLLTGNVRVIQFTGGENGASSGLGPQNEIVTQKMRVYLDESKKNPG